ncbi:MAG TPA: efflux RND transporter permease subunit [Candidatus Eisenbacteria bacterium]|jgi:HAE1 family hydrophobic/amphiphilic exporter-1
MRIVDASLKRPVTVLMVTAGLVIFGLVAASRLSVDLLPDISYPSLTVRTDLPDAAPGDVEQFVTRPVEEAVGVVPGLVRIHSVSRPGQSEVTMEFASGTRMDLASLAAREKLDLITLPREAKRPAILRFDPSLDPILRVRLAGGGNLQRVRRIAERTLKTDLEGAPGVAAVRVAGGEEEEIQVEVDARRLSAAGLTLADVTQRLGQENVNVAGGSLTEGQAEYLVRVANQFLTPGEMGGIVLASNTEGIVRLSDVATVARGARERDVVARVGKDEAVEIAVFKEGDANTVAVARTVKARLKRLPLPAGMKLITVADQSRFIESSVGSVVEAALIGGLLAILVIFAFLRDLRSTLTISLSIPLSVFATFIAMYRMGLSLNLMSLGGLALGVGMLVDDSIVVLESIFRTREHEPDIRRAASQGTGIVAMAITASTLTTVVVFLPLVFVEGVAGQLIRDQALTVSLSLLASLVVALIVVPTIAAVGGRARREPAPADAAAGEGRRGRWRGLLSWLVFAALFLPRMLVRAVGWIGRRVGPWVDRLFAPVAMLHDRLEAAYPRLIRPALAHRGRVLALAGVGLAAAVAAGVLLPRNLFPSFSQGEFHFDVRLPEGTALHVTDATLERLARTVGDDPRVRFVYTSSGQTNLTEFAGAAREANRGQIAVVLKPNGPRGAEDAIASRLRAALSDVPGLSYEFGRPALLTFKSPVEIEVYTYDLDTLRTLAARVAQRVAAIPGIEDVESSMRIGDPEVQIAFDRERLATLHLDPAQASRLVRNAVQGEAATEFSDVDRKLDVRVRAIENQRSQVTQLASLEVGRNQDRGVPLGAVANISVERGPGEIRRIAQQRAAVVSANLKGRDLGSASHEIEGVLSSLDLPPSARVILAGQNRELGDSFASIRFALLLAIFLVYLVMASQFESLLHPFVIMFTLPLGVIGVVLTLVLTRSTVSVMVLIGVLVLSGIVVKNAIMLVDYTNRLRAAGRPKLDALCEAGSVRLRPILMTTLTTVLGLLPMALGIGEGSEVGAPLALTIMGGLSFATVLTLVVIPVVYATLDRTP